MDGDRGCGEIKVLVIGSKWLKRDDPRGLKLISLTNSNRGPVDRKVKPTQATRCLKHYYILEQSRTAERVLGRDLLAWDTANNGLCWDGDLRVHDSCNGTDWLLLLPTSLAGKGLVATPPLSLPGEPSFLSTAVSCLT